MQKLLIFRQYLQIPNGNLLIIDNSFGTSECRYFLYIMPLWIHISPYEYTHYIGTYAYTHEFSIKTFVTTIIKIYHSAIKFI